MIKNSTSAKSNTRHGTPLVTAFVSGVSLAIVAGCLVVAFGSYALGFNERQAKNNSEASRKLVATERVEHLDLLAREPMVVELNDGTLFVSGYDGDMEKSPNLWRSRNHGAGWERVNVGSKAQGAMGNSDVDLAVAPNGTLYFVTMVFNREAGEGKLITVGVSKNAGSTWSWTILSKDRFDDRPWVGVAPDGTVHVIWNDGNGVRYAVSQDGGANWNERSRINGQGGSSHLAVGPHGEVAVRITPSSASGNKFTEGVDLIAVSLDAGKTWRKHAAPGQRDWSPDDDKGTPRWVEPIAWDASGTLYYLWGTAKGLWLARSSDQGETWTNWHLVDRDEVLYYPYLIARGRGELAATWASGDGDTLKAHVARIDVSDGKAPPQVIESQPFQTDTWSRAWEQHPGEPAHRVTAGEYIPITFLRSGGLGVVTTIQNPPEKRFGFTWWKFVAR
jgi:hypothetical protein